MSVKKESMEEGRIGEGTTGFSGLNKEQLATFKEQGFLVLENFVPEHVIQSMIRRANDIVDEFTEPESLSVFSTRNQKSDQYFLDSANGVHVFFEEGALDDTGHLQKPKEVAINKIGHAMHDVIPEFRDWARSEQVKRLLQSLGYQKPLPVQSMYIFKQPKIGGEVVPHQDGCFLATEPQSVVGLWIALEDASVLNGCLWGLRGSHTNGIHKRFVRSKEDNSVSFKGELPEYDLESFTPLEVTRGSLVLLHGANVHFSKENTSEKSRHAFSVHYVEGGEGYTYLDDNWLQRRPDFPFKPLV